MLMRTHKIKGFTLIELMVAVAILGIITAIALPNYKNSVRKSKRQVAISDMLLYKQAQERYRTTNIDYGTLAEISVAPYTFNKSSKDTDYVFTITNVTGNTYTINATAQGTQALGGEANCTPLTLTEADIRGPNPHCWAR